MSNHRAEEKGGASFSVVHTQSDIIIEKRALEEQTHNNNANRFRAETFRVRIKQNPTRSI